MAIAANQRLPAPRTTLRRLSPILEEVPSRISAEAAQKDIERKPHHDDVEGAMFREIRR